MFPVIDLHCDLLLYLMEDSDRLPEDRRARCSIPQMREGGVKVQTLAIFTEVGPDSTAKGLSQAKIFAELVKNHPHIIHGDEAQWKDLESGEKVAVLPSIESAAGFCGEDESLEQGFSRFDEICNLVGKPLYVSLTWNEENRFGGGNLSNVGLKDDGKKLIEFLATRGVAVDFSHTSDALARDILEFTSSKGLDIPVLASHSNYRPMQEQARNLPDDVAREIIQRGGLIGLNAVRRFLGEEWTAFLQQLEYGRSLGGLGHLAMGLDFFYEGDLGGGIAQRKFFDELGNASIYPLIFDKIQAELGWSHEDCQALAHGNALKKIRSWRAGKAQL